MPSIYLKQTEGSYEEESVRVTVQKETYSTSNLFTKYKHKLGTSTTGKIWIYKERYSYFGFDSNHLTITLDNSHKSAKLTEAHVYFNKYDTDHENPLVFVLVFNNGEPKLDKYYTRSKFSGKLSGGTEDISQLCKYENDGSILKALLEENDKLPQPLTYQIEKIKGDSSNGDNGGASNGEYNNKKIKIVDDTSNSPKLTNGFKCYKHTPVVNGNGHDSKKACVIYDGNVLMKKEGDREVENIQNEEYNCIRVYFGKKAKKESVIKGGPQPIDVPLLIELNKKEPPNEPEYYVHKRKPDSGREYYWEQLPGSDGNTLKDLLTDMGFGMTNADSGYNQLKTLLSTALANGVAGGDDLSDKLNGITGNKLKRLLSQKIPESSSGPGPQKSLLVLLLEKIQFDLVDSVIVLLDKKDTGGGSYDEGQVGIVVSTLDPKREINRVKMNSGSDKNITVKDATGDKGKCVKDYKYKVYEHDFNSLVSGLDNRSQSHAGIRFIMPSKTGEREYKQLSLYTSIKEQGEPRNLEYKYYHNSGRNGISPTNSDKVYVWFYDKDPRPLMLCYNNTTYAPKTKERYFTQWAKVNELATGNLNECGCNGQEPLPENNNKLLQELDKVVKFLNQVNLKEGTSESGSGRGPHKYEVQKFKGSDIQIQVTCSRVGGTTGSGSREGTCTSPNSTSCYKKFEHKPIGMQNGLQNGSGFRLGEVQYIPNGAGGKTTSTLDYKTLTSKHPYHPLVCVTVYYYQHDTGYSDPLLVELEFKKNGVGDNEKEYYKLQAPSGSSDEKKWELDITAEKEMSSKAVKHLDKIRYDLKQVMKILIDKQTEYPLCLSTNAGGTDNGYKKQNGDKKIQVSDYKENGCSKLSEQGYKCYVHKVSEINGAGTFDYNPYTEVQTYD